jgi:hypothetical protein
MISPLIIFCADIGSIKNDNFAWARGVVSGKGSIEVYGRKNISELVDAAAEDLNSGAAVALGFECPLFVPISDDPVRLTSARNGEGNRAWSAGAGLGALATGLTETVWILRELHKKIRIEVPAFVNWSDFCKAGNGLFLWEAFVTGSAKGKDDLADAEKAVRCFAEAYPNILAINAIVESKVHSLIGAALLRTGWSTDLLLLEVPCVVIKA